ncbi:MAG TPA: archease [Atribacteraceae bacterium]|nr:archease [Atribacteraceae bacterium]
MKSFEILDHTADIGIVARGRDLKELFANAARGMFSVMTDLDRVNGGFDLEVSVEGNDYEDLLVTWLNELLYVYEVKSAILGNFLITDLGRHSLKALVRGEPIDLRKHTINREIKACTYYEARVGKNAEGFWEAQVYFDL